jgi:flagellar motor protein MotB
MLHTHAFRSLSSPVLAFLYEAAVSSTLVRFASVLALGASMTKCVPAKSYDEARTAAESEFTAHGRTRQRLEAAHERIRSLEQSLVERERALETGESSVAAAKLETIVASKDKEAAMDLVEQLRSELARTGNHLVAFSDEKRDLARAVMLAEERVKSLETAEKNIDELLATARDLSVALGANAKDEGVELGARDGQIVLSIPASKLFAEGSDSLVVDAAPLLGAVSTVTNQHPRIRVVLDPPEGDKLGAARVVSLGQALVLRGVPEARLVLPASENPAAPVATEAVPLPPSAEAPTPGAPETAPAPAAKLGEAAAPNPPLRFEIRLAI